MLEIIQNHNLVEHTKKTGDALYAHLETLAASQPKMQNLRGKNNGTFIAWDFATPGERDAFVARMRVNGVQMGGCGDKSVGGVVTTCSGSRSLMLPWIPLIGPAQTDIDVQSSACRHSGGHD